MAPSEISTLTRTAIDTNIAHLHCLSNLTSSQSPKDVRSLYAAPSAQSPHKVLKSAVEPDSTLQHYCYAQQSRSTSSLGHPEQQQSILQDVERLAARSHRQQVPDEASDVAEARRLIESEVTNSTKRGSFSTRKTDSRVWEESVDKAQAVKSAGSRKFRSERIRVDDLYRTITVPEKTVEGVTEAELRNSSVTERINRVLSLAVTRVLPTDELASRLYPRTDEDTTNVLE